MEEKKRIQLEKKTKETKDVRKELKNLEKL